MDTNSGELLAKKEVFQIVGCAIEVLNALGHGLVEKPYENALAVEFGLRNVPFQQQPSFAASTQAKFPHKLFISSALARQPLDMPQKLTIHHPPYMVSAAAVQWEKMQTGV